MKTSREKADDEVVRSIQKWLKMRQDPLLMPTALSSMEDANEDRRLVIIVNPTSGGKTGLKVLHDIVLPVLNAGGIHKITVVETLSRFSVPQQVADLNLDEIDDIIVIGGDGTLCGVVLGLSKHQAEKALSVPVGLIPCGSHNHMFKVMSGFKNVHGRVRQRDVLLSLYRVCRHETTNLTIPLVQADGRDESPFMCGLSFALLAAAFKTSEKLRWTGLRKTRYYASILYHIFRMRKYSYDVRYLPATSEEVPPSMAPDTFSEEWVAETGPYQWLGFSPLSFGVPREEALNDGWGYLMTIENARSPFGIIKTVLNPSLKMWETEKNARLVNVKALSIRPLGDDREWNMDGEKMDNFDQVYVRFAPQPAKYLG
eukprot:jgi/Bigna1/131337/aug1.14_g6045